MYDGLAPQTVKTHFPYTSHPSKGVAFPLERKSAEDIFSGLFRSHTVKSSPIGMPNRRRGFTARSSISFSRVITPSSTSFVYRTGKAVSSPTIPKALPERPFDFS